METPKPDPLEVLAQNIPIAIQKGKTWVGWKWVWKPGENGKPGEWTKPPFSIENGHKASTTNPQNWTHFNRAINAYLDGKFDGIGRVIRPPFVGIDLDKCRDPLQGEIQPWAEEIITKFKSYTEISPSGTGVKIWIEGKIPGKRRRSGDIEFYDGKTVDGKDGGRYFTVTGQHLEGTPYNPEKRQNELDELYSKVFASEKKAPLTVLKNQNTQPTHSIDDSKIIEKALEAKDGGKFRQLWQGDIRGYPSQSEADQALCNKLAFWVGVDVGRIDALFRQSGLMREKWDREDYRTRTIERAIASVTETYKPVCPIASEAKQIKTLEFPSWVMAGVAGDFANLYSSYLEVPAHFFYMAFLTCLGSTLASSLTLASEITPQPRLFVLLLGESADDRKSTALNKVVDFFKWSVDGYSVCWGVGSAEGLQKRLEDNKRLLLCFDEFKQFISKCKIEASVLLPCVNTLFESNRYESRTKKTDIYLENVYLCLMAASTVDTYENTWSSQFTDIGFNNRLFLVPGSGERKHSFPTKIPDNAKYLLKQRLAEILAHVGDGLELDITPKARELYHHWYMNLEKSVYTKRLDVYALRLMSLLAVNELKAEVNAEVVSKVIALCDWQYSVRALHDPIDADNAIAGMEEKIRRALKTRGPLTDRDVKRHTNASRTGLWAYNTAKKNLMLHKEVGFDKKGKTYFLRD